MCALNLPSLFYRERFLYCSRNRFTSITEIAPYHQGQTDRAKYHLNEKLLFNKQVFQKFNTALDLVAIS